MTHISNIIDLDKIKKHKDYEESCKNEQISEETAHIVNLLFRELRAIFPAFRQAWPTEEEFNRAKINWIKAFQHQGLNKIELIRCGVEKCRLSGRPFAPSVGEFIEWCKRSPTDCGLPEIHQAFIIAGKINELYGTYIHHHAPTDTVLNHVLLQIGSQKFRAMKENEAFKMFGHYYVVACRQYADGTIKDIARSITDKQDTHPSDRVRSNEARLKAMASMRALGMPLKIND